MEGLDAGADDYLAKPFSVEELAARMRVAIRHLTQSPGARMSRFFKPANSGRSGRQDGLGGWEPKSI